MGLIALHLGLGQTGSRAASGGVPEELFEAKAVPGHDCQKRIPCGCVQQVQCVAVRPQLGREGC